MDAEDYGKPKGRRAFIPYWLLGTADDPTFALSQTKPAVVIRIQKDRTTESVDEERLQAA